MILINFLPTEKAILTVKAASLPHYANMLCFYNTRTVIFSSMHVAERAAWQVHDFNGKHTVR